MRTAKAKDRDLNEGPRYYVSSLSELPSLVASYSEAERNPHRAPDEPFSPPAAEPGAPKWLVCHDYKGGYTEARAELKRDYTFTHWHLVDSYIYFSHQRVSCPPPALIRCAHRHGTAILGTLIFEWDDGQKDLINWLDRLRRTPDGINDSQAVAVHLAELAASGGFDGWLVNIEVPARDSAQAGLLAEWLTELSTTLKKIVSHGQVLWYDGLNMHNKVEWQNKLTPVNQPFLDQSDGIFLNYFWEPADPAETALGMDQLGRARSEAYFGVDVWGRSQYGGGGFDSWIALDVVNASRLRAKEMVVSSGGGPASSRMSKTCSTSSSDSLGSSLGSSTSRQGLSTALFAPAWTVESEHLAHNLSTAEGFVEWFRDEMYLWAGWPATENVRRERARRDEERRLQRSLHYVLRMAAALAAPECDWPKIHMPAFDESDPLPPLPGVFKPMTSYRRPRPPPCANDCFYTNFGIGSGHSFAFGGNECQDATSGWTDWELCFPAPSLAYAARLEGVSVELTEERAHAWLGAHALKLTLAERVLAEKGAITVPLFSLSLAIEPGKPFVAGVVWMEQPCTASLPHHQLSFVVTATATDGGAPVELVISNEVNRSFEPVTGISCRWFQTEANISMAESGARATIDSIAIRITRDPRAQQHSDEDNKIVIGEFHLGDQGSMFDRRGTRNLYNRNLDLGIDEERRLWLRWETVVPAEGQPSPGPRSFLWTAVWCCPPPVDSLAVEAEVGPESADVRSVAPRERSTLLGITTAREFELPENHSQIAQPGSSFLIQGLRADGSLEDWVIDCQAIAL